jgi:ATP-binding cassette subfamily B protein RaxB
MNLSYQSESSECGLACLAIVTAKLGAPVDLSELRRKHVISSRGVTLRELIEIAASMGLIGRAIRCELDELPQLKCPTILHWGLHHYVVLEGFKNGKAIIHDPNEGRSSIDMHKMSRFFTGVALEVSPAPEFQKRKERSPLSLWSWFRLTHEMYGSLTQILILSLLLQAYVLASPMYMQMAIDQAALKGDHHLLATLAVGYGLFALFNAGANTLRGIVTIKLTALLNWDMTLRLFRHMIRLPLPWFQRRKLADILSRFDSIGPVRDLISGGLVSTLVDGVLALVTLCMMFMFSPSLAAVVAIGFSLFVVIRLSSLPLSIRLGMNALMAHIAETGKRIETVRAIQTLKIMGAENARESDWANKFAASISREQTQNKANLAFSTLHDLVDSIIHVVLIYIGATAIIEGNMSVGLLFAFMSYQTQFSARAGALFEQIVHWKMTDIYSYRLADIVLSPKEAGLEDSNIGQPPAKGAVELSNVSFSYAPQEPLIFKSISLKIEPGEFVAIVGPSGAGKSTLLKVLCGLYPAVSGEVKFDGRRIESWGPKAIRRSLGVVMQDDELLSGTIAENVAFFDDQIDIEWVWSCLKLASLDEDVLKMPMRIETFIGDMGSTLSGGQKQRLLLARALYRRPQILVLDEATCHLDSVRESAINNALQALSITRIIVAHRQETIDAADRIIRIEDGVVAYDVRNVWPATSEPLDEVQIH